MCSLIALLRPGHDWPLLLAANRDEMAARPSRAPARHWPDRPHVLAGLDETAGGSWMGMNDDGVVACVLNRVGSLGPAPRKRSRGELVLEALDHATAGDAAWAMADLDPIAYRSFNLFIADNERAFWLRHRGVEAEAVEVMKIKPGLSMLTAHDVNDLGTPRIARYLPRFKTAAVPDPGEGDWTAWAALLAERDLEDPAQGLTISLPSGFGTVSSSLLALPSRPRTLQEAPRLPVWRYADGPPDRTPYRVLPLT
jgi:hypothetical protein